MKYKSRDIPNYPGRWKGLTAQDIWNRDNERIEYMKNIGYDVLIIWESEFKINQKNVIKKCKKFLTQ